VKQPVKGAPEEAALAPPSAFDKLNAFGERNAKAIIIVSTLLVIVTVLIVAESLYRKSQISRAEKDRAGAHTSADLRELKDKYKDVETVVPLIMLDLANKLYAEEKLDEAEKEYAEFIDRFGKPPEHPLIDVARKGRGEIQKNRDFLDRSKAAIAGMPTLDAHPLRAQQMADSTQKLRDEFKRLREKPDPNDVDQLHLKGGAKHSGEITIESEEVVVRLPAGPQRFKLADVERIDRCTACRIQAELDRRAASSIGIAPVKQPHPVLVVRTKAVTFKIELFEDEAPNAVAQLITLAKAKHFDGLKFEVKDEQLRLLPKDPAAPADTLEYERTSREGDVGSVLLIRKSEGGDNLGAEFVILTKDRPLKDETVVGILMENGSTIVRGIKAEDVIETVTVENLRDHEYRPVVKKP
jgi:cyclophilin family peptidyl-prolyl cis-trans isomerase